MKGHVKKVGHMSQPATGWYADCSCGGLRGGLKVTKQEAHHDFANHIEQVRRDQP